MGKVDRGALSAVILISLAYVYFIKEDFKGIIPSEWFKESSRTRQIDISKSVTRYPGPAQFPSQSILEKSKKLSVRQLTWHPIQTQHDGRLIGYLLSAFLHERPGGVYVDIVAMFQQWPSDFLCIFWWDDKSFYRGKRPKVELNPEHHNKTYKVYMIMCQVNTDWMLDKPTGISLIETKVYQKSPNHITNPDPVFIQVSSVVKPYKFTVCLTPKFEEEDYPNFGQFLAFIEINRYFGADNFIIYNHDQRNDKLKYLFKSYEEEGVMEVINFKIPIESHDIYANAQILALQDCIFRSRAHSRFVVSINYDEYIVPLKEKNWMDMLQSVTKGGLESGSSFIFKSAQFPSHWPINTKYKNNSFISKYLILPFLYTKRENRFRNWNFPSKYIGDPEKILSASLNSPIATLEGTNKLVDTKDAYVFHYTEEYKEDLNTRMVKETRMLDFYKTIEKTVFEKLKKF